MNSIAHNNQKNATIFRMFQVLVTRMDKENANEVSQCQSDIDNGALTADERDFLSCLHGLIDRSLFSYMLLLLKWDADFAAHFVFLIMQNAYASYCCDFSDYDHVSEICKCEDDLKHGNITEDERYELSRSIVQSQPNINMARALHFMRMYNDRLNGRYVAVRQKRPLKYQRSPRRAAAHAVSRGSPTDSGGDDPPDQSFKPP